jgi:allantoate deiminase
MPTPARQLRQRIEELARISDEPVGLTRTFLSPAMRRANARVGQWMKQAGLAVRQDAFGNLIGRLAPKVRHGNANVSSRSGTFLLGSHLDTVRDAGRFDGALGVLLAIAAVEELRRRRVTLPFAVEVVGFSEEEGVRFSSAYLGSKAYTGQLRSADLKLRDGDGISVAEAVAKWNSAGVRPPKIPQRPQASGNLLGYLEVHIEQGPVLESKQLAVGVVSAIAGQTRGKLTFRGEAGHAGTTPMNLRRDALAGAAEMILHTEAFARRLPPLVATIGTVAVVPGAANVIPGEVVLSLDLRHPRDRDRRAALKRLLKEAGRIARVRNLRWEWQRTQENDAVICSGALSAELEKSVRIVQRRSLSLVSGAGHDAVVLSAVAPVAMLFVRCRDGLSHHPDEFAAPADIDIALRVTVDFLERLARGATGRR